MKVKNLNKRSILLLALGFLFACSNKQNDSIARLDSFYVYDSISGDSVYLPYVTEFDDLVDAHLALTKKGGIPNFMYNVYLDTLFRGNNFTDDSYKRSVRAAVISQITDVQLLHEMLVDPEMIRVWSAAQNDSAILRTNLHMISDRLSELERSSDH
jgi:hypothetical protein